MAKKGRKGHTKRLAAEKSLFITDKKENTWLITSSPGAHPKSESIPLSVLLRDILKVAKSASEAKKITSNHLVSVDGKSISDEAFPVGFMDVVSFTSADKHFRLLVDHKGRLAPIEIQKNEVDKKILKIVKKHVAPKKKIILTSHDGRNIIADNNIRVGDSVIFDITSSKVSDTLKLQKGARCLIREGKHAGSVAKLEEFIQRKEGKESEARMSSKDGEFVTVAKYLFVVNETVKGV
ncbi:30S ribosomal protein S4e [Candidatus Micrarchaeota archaeon]|nr:30S ribosomal protein S4e [Candidatus Micrarchaeota archaeon]